MWYGHSNVSIKLWALFSLESAVIQCCKASRLFETSFSLVMYSCVLVHCFKHPPSLWYDLRVWQGIKTQLSAYHPTCIWSVSPDSWSKSCEFQSRQERRENDLLGVRSTLVLPQWHVKDPDHSAKSTGGRLHLNTHTPLTHRSRSRLAMPLCRHSVGTFQKTSSHATRQGTLDHSRLSSLSHSGLTDLGVESGISVHKLISTLKKNNNKTHTHD